MDTTVVFKALIVVFVGLWSLGFALMTADIGDKQGNGKLMALSFGLACASGLAWWVVAR